VRWLSGTEVIGQYKFIANSSDDLPFKRGDILTIVRATADPSWYVARAVDGKEGMIPANYVQERTAVKMSTMPWYHGKITREQAEQLMIPREDGLFLVRESANFPGDYTLCVSFGGKVEHYRIKYSNNRMTVDDEIFFDNMVKLVEHYIADADGLCTRLQKPVKKQGNVDIVVDQEEFIKHGWQIKLADLKLGEQIGKGQFGDVILADYLGTPVAVKVLKDKTMVQQFLTEAYVMTTLRHENLVRFIGIVLGQVTHIVTEYMSKGSLVDYLRTRGRAVITPTDQINFSSDTCNGMAYLESRNVVHRDLAARNVLIHESGKAKVSDFGLASEADFNQTSRMFPIKWTAPEALHDSKKFTNKSDMWSFGILLWEIYSFGRVPYPRIPLADVLMHVDRGYRMEAPEGCPREVYTIMQQAWQANPADRPTFAMTAQKLAVMCQSFTTSSIGGSSSGHPV
jgi:c-src tyrosine kinase